MKLELFETLNMPAWIRREIKDLESELEAYRQTMLVSGISYDGDKVKTSPKDRMPEYAARVDSILEKIKERQQAYLHAHDKVIRMAAGLQPEEKSIIIQRYLEGKRYEDIAAGFPMSERQMFNYRRAAIQKLEKKISVNCSK